MPQKPMTLELWQLQQGLEQRLRSQLGDPLYLDLCRGLGDSLGTLHHGLLQIFLKMKLEARIEGKSMEDTRIETRLAVEYKSGTLTITTTHTMLGDENGSRILGEVKTQHRLDRSAATKEIYRQLRIIGCQAADVRELGAFYHMTHQL